MVAYVHAFLEKIKIKMLEHYCKPREREGTELRESES
jgi:hypothetical protein